MRGTVALASLVLVFSALARGEDGSEDGQFCRFEDEDTLICKDLTNEKQLDDALASGASAASKLLIADSSFRFFLHDSFVGTNFKAIEIRNCSLLSLTNTDVAFEGLEDRLESLSAVNVTFVMDWDWDHLRHLRALFAISVAKSNVMDLTEDMKRIPRTVKDLDFYKDEISWIQPDAFSHLRSLRLLMMSNNEISTLRRSMLPDPAPDLSFMFLRNNRLRSLPPDFFTNMPSLIVVYLDGNLFQTLDERTFAEVIGRILFFDMENNPLLCDCRLKWLTKVKVVRRYFLVPCSAPSHLQGRSVFDLQKKDLWC